MPISLIQEISNDVVQNALLLGQAKDMQLKKNNVDILIRATKYFQTESAKL